MVCVLASIDYICTYSQCQKPELLDVRILPITLNTNKRFIRNYSLKKINPQIVTVIETNVNEFRLSLCARKALVNVVFKRFKTIPDQINLILSTRIP